MTRFSTLLGGLLIIYSGFLLFIHRATFTEAFDPEYWRDKYDHSQWKLPVSSRILGDDGLFLYEGFRVAQGDDPTLLNAEVPPLGKYAIGAVISVFHNGPIYGFLTTTGALICFFLLARILFQKNEPALLSTALLAVDPMIASQFPLTMLDSLQLLLLFSCLISLFAASHSKKPTQQMFFSALSGLLLGLFSETKLPLFSPILVIIGIIVLRKSTRAWLTSVVFLTATAIGYLLPYIGYFLSGHTITEWISVQKWAVSFYIKSKLPPTPGSVLTALFFGKIQNLVTRSWESVAQWSPTWPLLTIGGIVGLWRQSIGKYLQWPSVFALCVFMLIGYLFVPFWSRYLVILLPFLYLGTVSLITKEKYHKMFGLGLILVNLLFTARLLFPTPEGTVKQFLYDWEHGFFQDMYERVTVESKTVDRDDFHRFGLTVFSDAEIEAVSIEILPHAWSATKSPQHIPLQITYATRHLGTFSENKNLVVEKERGLWRIRWDWDNLMDGLTRSATVETMVDPAKRGSIVSADGKLLARDINTTLISVVPGEVDLSKEEAMTKLFEQMFERKRAAAAFHHRYVGNSLPDMTIPIGVLPNPLDAQTFSALQQFPGIYLTPHMGRVYGREFADAGLVENTLFTECCSMLYATTSHDGKIGAEKIYNDTLKGYNGGTLIIKNQNGEVVRAIINLEKKDGRDVVLKK